MQCGYWRRGLDGFGHPTDGPDWDFTTPCRVLMYPGGIEVVWAKGACRHATTARYRVRGEPPVELTRRDAASIIRGVRAAMRKRALDAHTPDGVEARRVCC